MFTNRCQLPYENRIVDAQWEDGQLLELQRFLRRDNFVELGINQNFHYV